MHDEELEQCPNCHASIRNIHSRFYVSAPEGGTELRDKGFTKLVRRDDGIYENATAVTERLGMSDLTSPKRSRISRRSSGINADP